MTRAYSSGGALVLGGLAGTGKTEVLAALAACGEQVLDLEACARHRGSAFGRLDPQPAQADFERLIAGAFAAADPGRPLWLEDEGPFLGAVGLPAWLQRTIATSPTVLLEADDDERVDRLLAAYADQAPAALVAALRRTRRRLGSDRAARAIACVRTGRRREAIEIVLPYFDAAYRHRVAGYDRPLVAVVARNRRDAAQVAASLRRPCPY